MRLDDADRERIELQVTERAGPSPAFFTLMLLSTLIATFGLLSNSTATVIGAMLVAPLMGPILGLALGLATGETGLFKRSLWAEALGIVLCVTASAVVAALAGPANIDYLGGEIAARTRPTLFDLGIGLAAGLAGGYATVNSRVGDSIGGVAIAVALVPPLSVCGISLAGALGGRSYLWAYAGGSFTLFLANFLTIELAAVALFLHFGLGHVRAIARSRGLLRGLGVQLVLLALVLVFLIQQFDALLERRRLERQSRQVVALELAGTPGAAIESLDIRQSAKRVEIELVVVAPGELDTTLVARMQHQLTETLGREVELSVATLLSTYFSSQGQRYKSPETTPDPEQTRRVRLADSVRAALKEFPGADLDNVRWPEGGRALVTVRSPYEFDGPRVALLESGAQKVYGQGGFPHLTVRTLLSRDFTADGPIQPEDGESRLVRELNEQVRTILTRRTGELPDGRMLDLDLRLEHPSDPDEGPLPTPLDDAWRGRSLAVEATVRSRSPISATLVGAWQDELRAALGHPVRLAVDNRLGRTISPP